MKLWVTKRQKCRSSKNDMPQGAKLSLGAKIIWTEVDPFTCNYIYLYKYMSEFVSLWVVSSLAEEKSDGVSGFCFFNHLGTEGRWFGIEYWCDRKNRSYHLRIALQKHITSNHFSKYFLCSQHPSYEICSLAYLNMCNISTQSASWNLPEMSARAVRGGTWREMERWCFEKKCLHFLGYLLQAKKKTDVPYPWWKKPVVLLTIVQDETTKVPQA